jgi:hypothetical protein
MTVKAVFRTIALLLTLFFAIGLLAQYGTRREARREAHEEIRDQPPPNAVSAGGNWTVSSSEDRMTAAKRVRFDLPADNARDSDEQARIVLFCTDGKLKLADFRPNLPLSRPNWPGFWGQPQMRVRVRVDDAHDDHSWNWVNGHFLSMDKGTTRELIGARLFRVEFRTPDGPRIAEFSPSGLDLQRMRQACDLTPKKP